MKSPHESSQLKIAYLIGQLGYGGSERQLYNYLCHLDPHAYQSIVIVFNPSPNHVFDEPLQAHGVGVHSVPLKCTSVPQRAHFVYRLLRQFSPDIVHSWSAHDNAYAGIIGRLAGIPVQLGSLRGSIYLPGFRDLPPLLRWLSLNSVSILTVNANSIAQELLQVGYPQGRVALLPNCVELHPPLPPPDLSAYGIAPDQPLIGTVGNLRIVKNPALFIDALAKVLVKFPNVRGVIVGQSIPGEGDMLDQLERHIQASGLQGKVILLGFRPDVPALMQRFSIYCLTSDSEGTPNTVLEAMAASRPVVATRVGGVPDLLEDGISGLLVDPGDHAALAAKLIHLLENPGLRREIGQAGMRVVERDYTCQSAVGKLAALYQSVLARRRSYRYYSQLGNSP